MTFKEKLDQYLIEYSITAYYSCFMLIFMSIYEFYNLEYNGFRFVLNFHGGFFVATFLLKMYGR